MEFFNKLGNSNKNALLVLGIVVFMILCLGLVTYLFFYNDQFSYDNTDTQAIESTSQSSSETQIPQEVTQSSIASQKQPQDKDIVALDSTATSTNTNQNTTSSSNVKSSSSSNVKVNTTNSKANTITALKYAIVPNNVDIFECNTMRNGKWAMPKDCKDSALKAIQKLIDDNNELIVLEVNGIVDSNPYAGPSAELKQEGLASFRAREAIGSIVRAYSNVAVFEGISMQENNKRGFQIKAYYLKK